MIYNTNFVLVQSLVEGRQVGKRIIQKEKKKKGKERKRKKKKGGEKREI